MEQERELHEVVRSEYFTGLGRLLILLYLGLAKKVDFMRAGLGASTVYSGLLKGTQLGLIRVIDDKIELTEKGRAVAEVLYRAFKEVKKIKGSSGSQ